MSQRHVESFIGRLAVDRDLRAAFAASPDATLSRFRSDGHEFAPVEIAALLEIDIEALARFAETLDARLRRLGQTGALDPEEIRRT